MNKMESPVPLLPHTYELLYDRLLAETAIEMPGQDASVTPFWPLIGWKYDGSLMVAGRSVNGWAEGSPLSTLAQASGRREVVEAIKRVSEPHDRCPMLWVTDLAGKTAHRYNTNRSAFWRVLQSLTLALTPANTSDWPSNLAWTNIYKLSPAAGWNPGADLQRAQRDAAIRLLRAEIDALGPRRLLALTGRWWISPFAQALGWDITWRDGLVEGIGRAGSTQIVIARHPMTKPHARFVSEVLAAFGEGQVT